MQKNKLFMLVSLLTLLGMVAAVAAAAGRSTPVAQVNQESDLLVPAVNVAQSPNWKADPVKGGAVALAWSNTRVNTDSGSAAQNEPFAAVNPHNANHIVVGANNWQPGSSQFEVTAYTSFDGGRTWAASQPYINRNASRLNAADPTVSFAADGTVYFAFVAFSPAEGAVAVSRSNDGGLTWASQSWVTPFTGGGADKPVMAAAADGLHVFYQTGAGLFDRTSANGATWSAATLVDAAGRYAAPVVDAAGKVSVFYTAGNAIKLGRTSARSGYTVSTVSAVTPLQGRPTQYRATIVPTAGVSANGTMYVAWADGRNAGRGNDIVLSRSVDGGKSWSSPATVNHDATSADQLFPTLSVEANGAVSVSYLDNRNDAANVNYDVYTSRAADGLNFSATDVRVTNVASNPNNDPYHQGSMIGDYFASVAANGVVYVFWTDTRNSNEDIFFAPVSVATNN